MVAPTFPSRRLERRQCLPPSTVLNTAVAIGRATRAQPTVGVAESYKVRSNGGGGDVVETGLEAVVFEFAVPPRCKPGTIQVRPATARASTEIAISATARRFRAVSRLAGPGSIA